jgi:hypothetical protein
MVTTEKAGLLTAYLAGLPEPLALRLAKAIELDRLCEGRSLPHDLILDGLRPALRRAVRVDRTPTPRRLFCRPFSDLLTSSQRREKRKGRIARSSIVPVWNWLSQTLLAEAASAYCTEARAAVLDYRPKDILACAAGFWKLAARAMGDALSDENMRKSARLALGGEMALADADEMATLLVAAPEICALQDAMPKPVHALSEGMLETFRALHDRLTDSVPDAAPYLEVIAMNRLERPWEALRFPALVRCQTPGTSGGDAGLAGELLLADLDTQTIAVRAIRQPQFDAGALIGHLSDFAILSAGIAREAETRRDTHCSQRLMKDRAVVAEIMDDMMKRAPREVLSAMPMQKTGAYAGGPRVPDLSRPFDDGKATRAENYARLLAGCRSLAEQLAFGAALAQADDEIGVALKSYCNDLVRELRALDGTERSRAEQYFAFTVDLASILFSAEEGEFLRRRGRAAVSAQAAA